MKVQLYAIFDMCSGAYEKPFFSTADDLVRREFLNAATAADTPIAQHPKDYSLWRLGNFDDNTGEVKNENNECLCTALEIISQSRTVDPAAMAALEAKVNGSDPETINPGLTD